MYKLTVFSGYELEYFQTFGLWFSILGITENLSIFKIENDHKCMEIKLMNLKQELVGRYI